MVDNIFQGNGYTSVSAIMEELGWEADRTKRILVSYKNITAVKTADVFHLALSQNLESGQLKCAIEPAQMSNL